MPLQGQKLKGIADIVICIDCTGSMQPCIDGLKSEINRFIDELERPPEQGLSPVNWQLKVIGFRDLNADSAPWENRDAPMVSDASAARVQVASLEADGGGDEPESTLDALWVAAASTEWRDSATRVIILFSDATALDLLHPSTVSAGAVANDASAVAQSLVEANCHLHAWAMPCPVWDTLKTLPRVVFTPLATGGDGLASLDFGRLMENLRKTVSSAASQGIQAGGSTVPIA